MRRYLVTKRLSWLLLFVMAVQILMPIKYASALVVEDPLNYVPNWGDWITDIAIAAKSVVIAKGTYDITFKEYVLDLIARVIAATLLRAMTNQVVGWIQGGNNVGFVANLDQEFRKAADQAGGEFLNNLTGLNLCGDIGAYLKISLRVPSGLRSRLQCSLTQIVGNLENFARRFQNGGWKAFFALELKPQNNLTGAYLIALDAKIYAETKAHERVEVGAKAGAGFLGFRVPKQVCNDVKIGAGIGSGRFDSGADFAEEQRQLAARSDVLSASIGATSEQELQGLENLAGFEKLCHTEYVTKTPGKLVSDTLSKTLNIGYDFAVVSDEINEAINIIVTALLQKLISSTFEIIDGSGEVTGGGEGIFDPGLSQIPIPTIDLQDNEIFIRIYENLFIADAALRSLDGTLTQKRHDLFALRKEISNLKQALRGLDPNSQEALDIEAKISGLGSKETVLEKEISDTEAKKTSILAIKFDLLLIRRALLSPIESTEVTTLTRELPNILERLENLINPPQIITGIARDDRSITSGQGIDVSGAVKPRGIARDDTRELFLGEKTNVESSLTLLNDTIAEFTRIATSTAPDLDRNRLVAQRGIMQLTLSLLGEMFDATVTARTREELNDILLASSRALIDSNQILDQGNNLLINTDAVLRTRSR